MRSAQGGKHENGGRHISGAEMIVEAEAVELVIKKLLDRAFYHSKGEADFINISLQQITAEEMFNIPALDITTVEVDSYQKGRECLVMALQKIGFSLKKACFLVHTLEHSDPMRGALLIDLHTLKRIDSNQNRGIRVTGMDWCPHLKQDLELRLIEAGINNIHLKEALALASKVVKAPGIVAEICWSDDPDYPAGYIASKELGYMRITQLKPLGDSRGGRVFCFDSSSASLEECIKWLEKEIVLINRLPIIKGKISCDQFMGG